MPHLTVQIAAEAHAPDGSKTPVPPALALQLRGPIVQVSVGVEQNIAHQLLQQGLTPPAPITGVALIDTGASVTCIDDGAAQILKLPAIDVVTVASASHAASPQNVYPIQVDVAGLPITISAPRAIGASLAAQGVLLLIGRDVLQQCTLFYNGPAGLFSLSV